MQCIEHGQLLSGETLQSMADRGVWLSIQPLPNDEDAIPFPPGSESEAKFLRVTKGTDHAYTRAKQLGVKMVFGTDPLFDPGLAGRQGKQLAKLSRWFEPREALKRQPVMRENFWRRRDRAIPIPMGPSV